MRIYRLQDVKQPRKLQPGSFLYGVAALAMLALLVFGYAGLYNLHLQNEALEKEIAALDAEKQELQKRFPGDAAIYNMAEELGMTLPDPWDMIILHIRED